MVSSLLKKERLARKAGLLLAICQSKEGNSLFPVIHAKPYRQLAE
jgi:hypothetical protein